MSEPKPKRACKDCGSTTRSLPYPGPRDATCHRAEQERRKAKAHEKRVQAVYGLAAGDYQKLYEAQDGRCAICTRATGATRKLSVDHDHATGYVRGLLCRPCNDMLGHMRDQPWAFGRAMNYLTIPPAWAVIGKVKPGADS